MALILKAFRCHRHVAIPNAVRSHLLNTVGELPIASAEFLGLNRRVIGMERRALVWK